MNSKTVAYHEAAHAVMCLSVGIPFKKVTIIPSGIYRGHLDTGGQPFNGLFQFVGAMECLMAGAIAQAHLQKKPLSLKDLTGTDRSTITKLLNENRKYISRPEAADFMAWIFKRTENHLNERFPALERIARALEATRTLPYAECKELMAAERTENQL